VVAIYTAIIAAAATATFAPRTDGYRLPRWLRVAAVIAVVGMLGFALVVGGIQ
jgi:hypothetical protein